jgi:choline monooxygenase
MTAPINSKASVVETFAPIKRSIPESRHLPGAIYTSPDYWQREKDRLFLSEWLMVCRAEELEKTGDYIALRIMGEPVLLVRNTDGNILALANVCRHRGVEVAHGRGNAPLLICPYHAWTYELDGRLKSAPYLGAGRRNPSDCNLRQFAVAQWRGSVFVNLSDVPRDFASFIAPFEEQFGFLQLENCRLARKVEFDMQCNWKFSLENLVDIYHLGTVHAKTFGGAYKGDKDNFRFNLLPQGGISFFEDAAPLTSTGKSLTGKMPWLADRSDSFSGIGLLWPNLRISTRIDYIRLWNIWPVAPDRTKMVANMLFPAAAFAQPDFEAKVEEYARFLQIAIEEDRVMIESLQQGVSSRNFVPGPLAQLEEAIHHFLNHYADVVSA